MSIANDYTAGNRGSNFHWQLVMTGAQVKAGPYQRVGGLNQGNTQNVVSTNETGSTNSPVAAGFTSVGFTTSSTFVGTINGIARAASTFVTFSANPGEILLAIPFTVTAGSVTIDRII